MSVLPLKHNQRERSIYTDIYYLSSPDSENKGINNVHVKGGGGTSGGWAFGHRPTAIHSSDS
jgi:hypothetical protein